MAEERNAEKQTKKTARSKAPPKKKTRYHWGKIRTEYVTGEKSYRELAKKHGVSMSQLSEVASKEGWAKLRAEHRAETAAKAEQKLKEQQAGALADELEGIRRTARNLSAAIEKKSLGKRLDSKSLRELVAILRDVFDQPNLLNQAKLDKETGKGPEAVEVVLDEEAEELSE